MDFESALPYLAGAVAIPIINFVKGRLNIPAKGVVILSAVLAGALGVAAVAFFGEGFDVLSDGARAFAAATVIYKLL